MDAPTIVGSFTGSPSSAGTFDQGGNVWELTEAIISGSNRVMRGGSFVSSAVILAASNPFGFIPTGELSVVGFRVASLPEPAAGLLVLTSMLGLSIWRRRRA